jgi:ParB-like chromosome segregation protein Spo0J
LIDTKDHIYKKVKVSSLVPYVNNSRTHSPDQVKQVASSIKEFGITSPVLIDEDGGIIAGHGRVMAMEMLGIEETPAIELVGLTNAQKKAYVIADNQLALNSGWDLDMLRLEVENLQEMDFDLSMLGFEDDVIDKLLDIEGELPELPDGDRDPFQQKTFTLHDDQVARIDDAVDEAKKSPLADTGLNENSNGNAIALICDEWLRMKNA